MARRGLILAALAVLLAAPASAQKSQKKELARIQSELRRTLAELEVLKASESSLGKDVSRLQDLDASSRRRVEKLQETIRRAENRRAELKSRLDSASRVDGFWTAALSAEVARHAAIAAGSSDFYGTRELWADEFRRDAILEKGRHLRGLKGFRRKTEAAEAAARRSADALAESRRRAQAERDGRRKEFESKKAQLAQTQTQVADAARRAKELEENAKALTSLIDKLSRKFRSRRPAGVKAVLDVPRHSLPWPAAGKILSGFGRERDPELGTWIVRQGVTIGTAEGSPVAAVAAGRVIFSGPFRSYGQVAIVDHGGGFFSVYGGLGQILKEKGADVRTREPIARAGAAKDGGGRVYFEIRRGTEALDPTAWLEKK
ncbi:MAG: peptidoglycan DD-metalloendopeptidase family protein [Elusimicrobia bacterium]|nr:peptidoglycan DD-metalloendopeptidase family protein [Elusimicrobiota bacterium]